MYCFYFFMYVHIACACIYAGIYVDCFIRMCNMYAHNNVCVKHCTYVHVRVRVQGLQRTHFLLSRKYIAPLKKVEMTSLLLVNFSN